MSLMAFTGYEIEELVGVEQKRLLGLLDIVVTGRYVRELKEHGLLWRGSTNQRIHYLTKRHGAWEITGGPRPVAEIVIPDSGPAVMTGFPDDGLLSELAVRQPPRHVPPAGKVAGDQTSSPSR